MWSLSFDLSHSLTGILAAIGFFSQWSGNGLISYYFNLILTGIGITTTFDQTLIVSTMSKQVGPLLNGGFVEWYLANLELRHCHQRFSPD